jgi:hypothetical protein
MRSLGFGWVVFGAVWTVALGCGQSEGGSDADGGGSGAATGGVGASGASTAAGKAGASATAGTVSGGSSTGGTATGGGAGGGVSTAGGQAAQAGAGSDAGGSTSLVDCDPKKIFCKRLAPSCDPGEVPSVVANCYGDCVQVDRCACSATEQCPEPDKYTCWAQEHCGPFVE